MTNTIDKIVMDMGKHSNNQIMQKNETTYGQANKIIEYLDRKRKMINLKVAVEECLAKLNKTDRRILGLVFIDGIKSEMVSQFLGVSLRTFFRKKIEALKHFNNLMISSGFDLNFFVKEYSCENWMLSIYNESVLRYSRDEEIMDNNVVKRMLTQVPQIKVSRDCYCS